jgi:hypothetical protein
MNRNCRFCCHYQQEEVGDSDFGAVYSSELTCIEYKDCDEEENLIIGFDRDIQRECCDLDFFKVADADKEIADLIIDVDEYVDFDKAYARFKEKYLQA